MYQGDVRSRKSEKDSLTSFFCTRIYGIQKRVTKKMDFMEEGKEVEHLRLSKEITKQNTLIIECNTLESLYLFYLIVLFVCIGMVDKIFITIERYKWSLHIKRLKISFVKDCMSFNFLTMIFVSIWTVTQNC